MLRTKQILLGLSLGGLFVNFRIIPYEIVPYWLFVTPLFFKSRVSIFPLLAGALCVFQLLLSSLYSGWPVGDIIGDWIKAICIIIVLCFLDIRKSDAEGALTVILLIWGLAGAVQLIFPDISFSFLMKAPSAAHSALTGRGISFLAPEPSYAGIFLVGCYAWSNCVSNKFYLPLLFSVAIIMTGSLWAYFNWVIAIFIFEKGRLRLIGVATIIAGITQSDRVFGILGKAFQNITSGDFSILDFERAYGSKRLVNNIESFMNEKGSFEWAETQGISFIAIGSELGILTFISSLIVLVFSARRLNLFGKSYLAYLLLLGGPAGIITSYIWAITWRERVSDNTNQS